jgi:DNA-binding beta-propeller fold protein YncE
MRRSFLIFIACALASPPLQAQGAGGVPSSGTLIVTNKSPATATIIDVSSGRVLATLPTQPGPHEVVLSRDGRVAVVSDYGAQTGGNTLTVIDVPSLRVARTISLGEYRRPHGMVLLPGDSLVAVTSETNRHLLVVRIATGDIVKAIATQQNGSHMVGVTASGTRAWTGNIGSNSISELDLVNGTALRNVTVPAQPEAINVTPDGREVWVGSNATGLLSVVDAANGKVSTAAEGFGWPYRVLFSPDNALVLLPDLKKEELRFVDRRTRRELGRLALPGLGPQGIIFTPDGTHAFLSLSTGARIAVIDIAARTVVREIAAGDTPDGIAYTTRVVDALPNGFRASFADADSRARTIVFWYQCVGAIARLRAEGGFGPAATAPPLIFCERTRDGIPVGGVYDIDPASRAVRRFSSVRLDGSRERYSGTIDTARVALEARLVNDVTRELAPVFAKRGRPFSVVPVPRADGVLEAWAVPRATKARMFVTGGEVVFTRFADGTVRRTVDHTETWTQRPLPADGELEIPSAEQEVAAVVDLFTAHYHGALGRDVTVHTATMVSRLLSGVDPATGARAVWQHAVKASAR